MSTAARSQLFWLWRKNGGIRCRLARRLLRSTRAKSVPVQIGKGRFAGTIIRLFHSETVALDIDTAMAIAGSAGVVGEFGEGLEMGLRYLSRQNVAIGGGTTEMARNVIGERVLGFPREFAADRGVPFNQVRHGQQR